jgi:GT2 family glycosyltransferase
MLGKYFNADFNTSCDWVNGAFFMFRKNILLQLPGNKLDDRFFMYGEDHLWCWQIQSLGYKNVFFGETTIVHINSASTSLDKRLALRKTMMKHELEIIRLRLGNGINYYATILAYAAKEYFRNAVKTIVYKMSGRLMR